MYEAETPLGPEVVDKYTPPALVAYVYPSVEAGAAAEGVEEVRIAVRWAVLGRASGAAAVVSCIALLLYTA